MLKVCSRACGAGFTCYAQPHLRKGTCWEYGRPSPKACPRAARPFVAATPPPIAQLKSCHGAPPLYWAELPKKLSPPPPPFLLRVVVGGAFLFTVFHCGSVRRFSALLPFIFLFHLSFSRSFYTFHLCPTARGLTSLIRFPPLRAPPTLYRTHAFPATARSWPLTRLPSPFNSR